MYGEASILLVHTIIGTALTVFTVAIVVIFLGSAVIFIGSFLFFFFFLKSVLRAELRFLSGSYAC
jgi:hypothetical protein